jgi:hypothetical protein
MLGIAWLRTFCVALTAAMVFAVPARAQITTGTVTLSARASERRGLQPVVHLTANGKIRAEVGVDQPVNLAGTIEMPPGAGRILQYDWHPGRSDFAYEPATKLAAPQPLVNAIRTVSFPAPGEYTITLRTYDSATASAISRAPRCSRISHASAWPCDDRRAIEIGRPRRREWPSAFACGPAALVRSLALVGKSDRLHQTLRPHGRSLTMRKPTAKGSPGPKA